MTAGVVSHTMLIYWWPVWLVGFILAFLTYADSGRLAVVPPGTTVKELQANKVYELTVTDQPSPSLESAAANTAKGQDAFPVRTATNKNYGIVYTAVLLLVIFGSNVPLRGLASVIAILAILLLTVLFAYLDWWTSIFDCLGGLHIQISLAGYLVPSVVLLVLWLATLLFYDPMRYMVFTPGQLVVHKEIGDLREVFDTTQVEAEKRRTDLFRHWVLGFGAGDLIIKVPSQSLQIELPNVLFVSWKVTQIADLMKTKLVLTQQVPSPLKGVATGLRNQGEIMNTTWKSRTHLLVLAAVGLVGLLVAARLSSALAQPGAAPAASGSEATVTVLVPAAAEVFFDGYRTTQKGNERVYTSPPLQAGKEFTYEIQARWDEGGKPVERTRRVPVTAGANVRVSFLQPDGGKTQEDPAAAADKQVVASKATRRAAAASVNFRKDLGLGFPSLATLGARIDAARRAPDPVALANAASELSVAEKVSGKTASLTSPQVLQEAAELAGLRRQVAELQAVLQVSNQVELEANKMANLKGQIALAQAQVKADRDAFARNDEPTATPRKLVVKNHTAQYVTVYVNGNYKGQVQPGLTQVFTVAHRWNPLVVTGYGDGELDMDTWGPVNLWGRFNTYTWDIKGSGEKDPY
jgi:uncharacterized protein (TIGR03000 family)